MVKSTISVKRPLGTTGLFLTPLRVDRITGNSRACKNPLPPVRAIRHVHGILPFSNARILFVDGYPSFPGEERTVSALVIRANPKYPRCHGCVFFHRPTSVSCSPTPIPFSDPSVVYDIKRRVPLGRITSRRVATPGTNNVQLELIKIKQYK